MLDTLLRIGKWQSEKMSKWDRFLDQPKTKEKKENLIAKLIIDLDEESIYLGDYEEYDEEVSPVKYKTLKILGRRNKAIYFTAEAKKVNQVIRSLWGKLEEENASGELIEVIEKDFPELKESQLYDLLLKIAKYKQLVINQCFDDGKKKFVEEQLIKDESLSNKNHIVITTVMVKSVNDGFNTPTSFASLADYDLFLEKRFLASASQASTKKGSSNICYASGSESDDVKKLDLGDSYSLNKMFVTTTKNHLSQFSDKLATLNYQVGEENQKYLDIASSYLVKKKNGITSIAKLDHVIIPHFPSNVDVADFDMMFHSLKFKSQLLFGVEDLANLQEDIRDEWEGIFWLNFVAFESDGNFFKVLHQIKDVSKFHFEKVLQTFLEVHQDFLDKKTFFNWEQISKNYGKSYFNLNSVYGLIPIREGKESKNKALFLMKQILEGRKIDKAMLYAYFSELMLCHYYKRQRSYKNIRDYGENGLTFAIRDSVFKYLALFKVLKKLNLIDTKMEEEKLDFQPAEEAVNDFDKRTEAFFSEMNYHSDQKAMFYLGRMLNNVVYLQKDKNKTVIDKLNFNGMDKGDIVRLRKDLYEKAKQYGKVQRVVFPDGQFSQHFDFNRWDMSPQEAIFFILTGYSFGIVKKETTTSDNQ